VFVATITPGVPDDAGGDAVVGYLVVDLVADPVPVARVDQVYVAAEARELGFGDALVASAMEWGRRAGAVLIEAETLPGDRELKNLYERARVTARLITVSKPL
jgi:GNAT superfamily N-acetyltransferase